VAKVGVIAVSLINLGGLIGCGIHVAIQIVRSTKAEVYLGLPERLLSIVDSYSIEANGFQTRLYALAVEI